MPRLLGQCNRRDRRTIRATQLPRPPGTAPSVPRRHARTPTGFNPVTSKAFPHRHSRPRFTIPSQGHHPCTNAQAPVGIWRCLPTAHHPVNPTVAIEGGWGEALGRSPLRMAEAANWDGCIAHATPLVGGSPAFNRQTLCAAPRPEGSAVAGLARGSLVGMSSMGAEQRRQAVERMLADDPATTQQQLAEAVGVSQSQVQRDVAELRKRGVLPRG